MREKYWPDQWPAFEDWSLLGEALLRQNKFAEEGEAIPRPAPSVGAVGAGVQGGGPVQGGNPGDRGGGRNGRGDAATTARRVRAGGGAREGGHCVPRATGTPPEGERKWCPEVCLGASLHGREHVRVAQFDHRLPLGHWDEVEVVRGREVVFRRPRRQVAGTVTRQVRLGVSQERGDFLRIRHKGSHFGTARAKAERQINRWELVLLLG